jgi:arylsulfatase A-like enzyme
VEDVEKIEKVVEVFHELPTTQELAVAGVAKERYLEAATAWYDASIRAMDAEIARLVERLEELRLADSTLLAFVGDHGEEFLEHGRSWHGQSIYGDMINVPMLVRWPGVVPAGLVVEATTQQIDLMPTLLELALLPVPEGAQGRSLLPLLAAPDDPASLGWRRAPVFAERKEPPGEPIEKAPDAYAVIDDGWKLIWNVVSRDERPEFELFDHEADPLNLSNLAEAHPDQVERLREILEAWRQSAGAAKVSDEGLAAELSQEELEELKALGYVQ